MSELGYDGVVLAAGKNTRLKGLVPSYYKPLVIAHGKPLIVGIVRNLLDHCNHVVVTVSPENCIPISEVLMDNDLYSNRITLLVQPTARGPGEALYRAMRCCHAERIILACGDNVIPKDDFTTTVGVDEKGDSDVTVSAIATTDYDEASRFTRVIKSDGGWEFVENREGGLHADGLYYCWVGPIIFDRENMEHTLAQLVLSQGQDAEIKISPALNILKPEEVALVRGRSVDIGTSEALVQFNHER